MPRTEGPVGAAQRAFTMAAFLVAAGNHSYYSYADWAGGCWSLAGTRWWPEFDRPLGDPVTAPLQRAKGARFVYERNFSRGAMVRIDVAKHEATIVWGR